MIIEEKDLLVDTETGEVAWMDTSSGELDILKHYGMPRRSGRYPWGSGENPYQRTGDFVSRVAEMKAKGMSEGEIAKELDILNYKGEPSPSRLRQQLSVAKQYRRSILVQTAKDLKAKGMGNTEIGEQMGLNESSVRSLLNEKSEARMNSATNTARYLKEEIDKNGMIDVGVNTERVLGVTRTNLDNALMILQMEGYPLYGGRVPQATNKGQMTTLKVICPPGTEPKDIYDYSKIHSLGSKRSQDGGETFDPTWVYPKSMDSKRLQIRYAEEGGVDKDGVVELRPGVDDISLGGSHYAQVRVLVDGTHYIKGMAVYGDPKDFPDGVDMIFNTNKHVGTPMLSDDPDAKTVLKPIDRKNPNNPFGSLIKSGIVDPDHPEVIEGGQRYYYDKNGEKQLSLINKRSDEKDWYEWSHELPSQFLSKQNKKLVEQQLKLAKADKQDEYEEICALTNPTIKKHMLMEFARDCDSSATHLKAAALPRQSYQVILPLTSIKDDEVYAPNYRNGEKVALIRYPHGGTFEIPILKVNNGNEEGKRIITPNGKDAVGINSKVAGQLSGADFDGDTVMVIPLSGKAKITATKPFDELRGFDPKAEYGGKKPGTFKQMTKQGMQNEMGRISNLITDMTLGGATDEEKIRAVRHSMVVIDAYKHKLDYKQSEIDNDIQALKNKYQGRFNEKGNWSTGAATIISQASADARIPKYRGQQKIDPETGKLYWDASKKPETYVDKKGKVQERTVTVSKMAATDDAMTLVSKGRYPIELLYADYANAMKSMANDARKEYMATGKLEYKPEAAKKYAKQVEDFEAQLAVAELNAPREREAQLLANSRTKVIFDANPDMTPKEKSKVSQQELSRARVETGARRSSIDINPEMWEMIQAGGIHESKLTRGLKYTDIDTVRKYATPTTKRALSPAKIEHLRRLSDAGYTNEEIAEALDISISTVINHLD